MVGRSRNRIYSTHTDRRKDRVHLEWQVRHGICRMIPLSGDPSKTEIPLLRCALPFYLQRRRFHHGKAHNRMLQGRDELDVCRGVRLRQSAP